MIRDDERSCNMLGAVLGSLPSRIGVAAVLCAGLNSNSTAVRQAATPGETCGVVVKVVNGCEPQIEVKASDVSFKVLIPKKARPSFEPLLSSYDSATICVKATPAKPGKSFTFKATDPSMLRIAKAKPEPAVTGVLEASAPGIVPPRLLSQVQPKYTRDAMQAKIQGDVELTGVVLVNGTVTELRVVKSLDPCGGLDEEAIKAASAWRFAPAQLDGHPIPVIVTLILSFRLH